MKNIKFLLLLCLIIGISNFLLAEPIQVRGTITDETGQALKSATISVKGKKTGTISNEKGYYVIAAEIGDFLVYNYIGYEKKVLKVNKQVMNVQMTPSSQTLSEFNVLCELSVNDALQGQIAGLEVKRSFLQNSHRGKNIYQTQIAVADNEEYDKLNENRFISVSSEALSTFSLDVDAASYTNVRRMINQGNMHNKAAVRIEEMINYFSYNYPQPSSEHPVNILPELAVCPWNTKHQLLRIGVKAREIPTENLPNSNFVFLIDVSGSMQGANRLGLIKASLKLLTNNLRKTDRVSIVVYAGAAGVVLPSTSGSDSQKIKEALNQLTAGGSTAGGAGIKLAYNIAEKNFIKNGNNRIILCTDGDFNVGLSSDSDLEDLIEMKRKTGVYLTVLGYGMRNYKDKKLQILAQKGNGNHGYIDNIQEANKILINEFGSTMYTVAKDVKIQLEFNPNFVNAYRLIGYESRLLNKEDFNDDTKDAGELGSGHTVTALYEIIPAGVENTFGGVDDLKYQKQKKNKTEFSNTKELLTVKLRYKDPDSSKSKKLELPVFAKDMKNESSKDFKFAMAVAMFGQCLKNSDFKANSNYDSVLELAKAGLDNDENGYRREFVRLVDAVKQLEK